MKPIIHKLWIVIATLCISFSATAYDFEVDGIRYDITSLTDLTVTASSLSETKTGDIVIPSSVEFKGKVLSVTKIGANFAYKNVGVTSLSVGNNILEIEKNAFSGCNELVAISFGENVEVLEESSFQGCSKLQEISSETIKEIGNDSFEGCNSLVSVQCKNLCIISDGVFQNCNSLTNCEIPLISKVGKKAFANCISLKKINFPESIESIEDEVFKNCTALTEFVIPNSVKTIGIKAFSSCDNLKNILIPDSVSFIGKNAFYGCNNVDTISIGAGITEIEAGSIWGCNKMNTLIFGKADKPLKIGSFTDYGALINFNKKPNSKNDFYGAYYDLNVRNLIVERKIAGLSFWSFTGKYSSDFVSGEIASPFQDNIYIESIIFRGEFSLEPKSIEKVSVWGSSNIYSYYYDLDFKCNNCVNLKDITIQQGESTVIPQSCFSNCINLTALHLDGIDVIESNAFENCVNLKQVELPNISRIGNNAFNGCSSIRSISFPSTLSDLSNSIISCQLDSIVFHGFTPPSSSEFNNETYINCQLIVPFGYKTIYMQKTPWCNFWEMRELPEVLPETIELNIRNLELELNEEYQLTAVVKPDNTSDKTITWESSNPQIAIVDQDGFVKGISTGSTTIIASCGDITASCKVLVVEKVGFKNMYNTVTYNEMAISTTDSYFNYIPEIVGPYNEDDFWIELWFLDKDNKFDQHVTTISGGDYAGNYVNTNVDRPMWAGKYIFNLISKGTNPTVTASPGRAYLTVNRASNNLEWETDSPITVKVGEKVDLGISYQADLWCIFNTDYNEDIIELSSEGEIGNNPHWFATGLKEGETTLSFGIECKKNDMGFYDFTNSRTMSKRIIVEPSSGINDISTEDSSVYVTVRGGNVFVHNKPINEFVKIYSVQGTIIYETTEDEVGNLVSGFYIVTIGSKSFKIKL